MEVQVKKLPESKIEIQIVLPWEEWRRFEEHAALHMAESLKLPGFRRGKIPKGVLENRFGRGAILAETAEEAVREALPRALSEAKADAIGQPDIKVDEVVAQKPLRFSVVTAVLPEIQLGVWKKAMTKLNAGRKRDTLVVAETDIDREIQRLAEMRAKFIPVDRPAQQHDQVEIDFTVSQDGVVIEGGSGRRHPLVLGSGVFIPGFEDALIGMAAGEEKSFTLTFPAQYHATHLSGKPATFSVTLLTVQSRELPALDDAFARSVGRFESMAELRESVRQGMSEEKKRSEAETHRTALLDALVASTTLEYPTLLVEQETTRILSELQSELEKVNIPWEQYLEKVGKSQDDLRREALPQAKQRIAAELALDKIATDEAIDVDTETVEAEMNSVLQYYRNEQDIKQKLDLERLYAGVRSRLIREKILAWFETL